MVSAVTTTGGRPFFAALYAGMASSLEAGRIGAARRRLLMNATGVTLDLGAGIGLNLPHLPPDVTEVHLVEPDPHMIRRLRPEPSGRAVIHQAAAESLPLPNASVDTVLATLTLCTVADVRRPGVSRSGLIRMRRACAHEPDLVDDGPRVRLRRNGNRGGSAPRAAAGSVDVRARRAGRSRGAGRRGSCVRPVP
jgi:SAM-dependent methyltransferase